MDKRKEERGINGEYREEGWMKGRKEEAKKGDGSQ